jgi:hypothetical protein
LFTPDDSPTTPDDSLTALDRVRTVVAANVALGIKKKSTILAKALRVINEARKERYSHEQIFEALVKGGLEITPGYYQNLYSRESNKRRAIKPTDRIKTLQQALAMPMSQPNGRKLTQRQALAIREQELGKEEQVKPPEPKAPPPESTGFSSSADELRRARAVSRQDFTKLLKKKPP